MYNVPVSLQQSGHDWEQTEQAVSCDPSAYQVLVVGQRDTPLFAALTAVTAPAAGTGVEAYSPSYKSSHNTICVYLALGTYSPPQETLPLGQVPAVGTFHPKFHLG